MARGIIAWAIILTLGAIIWQAVETRRATNSQRDKDRARLSVKMSYGGQYADFSGTTQQDAFADFYPALGVEITQHGSTKAFNVTGHATVIVRPNSENRPTLRASKMINMGLPSIIHEDSKSFEGRINFRAVSDDVLSSINRRIDSAHFFGVIQYQDVFGVNRKTTFRYVWKPEWREPVPGVEGETFVVEESHWEKTGEKKDNRES